MTMHKLSRRRFLGTTVAAAGSFTFAGLTATEASADEQVWRGPRSANGWPVLAETKAFRIEGSNQSVHLADGDTATILLHVARRFNYEIDTLRDGDVTGHITDRKVTQPYESNYLSGTAIAIRPILYPAGASGLLYPNELTVVRDILAELDGAVSWGGDEKVTKECHFQIALRPQHQKIRDMARKIRRWDEHSGDDGAGTVDAFAPGRVKAAHAFEHQPQQRPDGP